MFRVVKIVALSTAFAGSLYAGVNYSEKANKIFNNINDKQISIYKVTPRVYSNEKVKSFVAFFKNKGIDLQDASMLNGGIQYNNNAKSQQLWIGSDDGAVTYLDNQIETLTDEDVANQASLRRIADGYIAELEGNYGANYQFVNCEFGYYADREKSIDKKLSSFAFRYVRLLDGRLVLGNTDYCIVSLGKNGTIGYVKIVNPELTKERNVKQEIAMNKMQKYLDRHLNSNKYKRGVDGCDTLINSVSVQQSTPSFFAIKVGNENYLIPHLSFITEAEIADGTKAIREVHIPVDAEFSSNVDGEDIVQLEMLRK